MEECQTINESIIFWIYAVGGICPAFTNLCFIQFSLVAQSCPTLCDPVNRSMPGHPVHHQLPEFTQTHVHRVSDASSHLILCRPLLFKKKKCYFLAALGRHRCEVFSLVAVNRGYFLATMRGLVTVVASPAAEHRLWALRLQWLWHAGSVVAAPGSGARAQWLWCMGLVAPRHVGSSCVLDRTHVSRTGRRILYTEPPGKPSLFSYSK